MCVPYGKAEGACHLYHGVETAKEVVIIPLVRRVGATHD